MKKIHNKFYKFKNNPTFANVIPKKANGEYISPTEFKKMIGSMGLTWHHHEGLNKIILIDGRIHGGIDHWGAVSILTKKLKNANQSTKDEYNAIIQSMS